MVHLNNSKPFSLSNLINPATVQILESRNEVVLLESSSRTSSEVELNGTEPQFCLHNMSQTKQNKTIQFNLWFRRYLNHLIKIAWNTVSCRIEQIFFVNWFRCWVELNLNCGYTYVSRTEMNQTGLVQLQFSLRTKNQTGKPVNWTIRTGLGWFRLHSAHSSEILCIFWTGSDLVQPNPYIFLD